VIFLGPGIVTWPPPGGAAPMLVVPGAGVLLRDDISAGAVALARCLADVTARIDPGEKLVALTAAQEGELLGWDAEKYRQALDRT
jgi:rhamnose utilization protein RhaD (predicted bifunctional aldolase and dehydrogenase)